MMNWIKDTAAAPEHTAPTIGPVEACVLELVGNAAKAGARNVEVRFSLLGDSLAVEDDGRGIRKFDAFPWNGESLQHAVVALGQRPMMTVESTNEAQINSALVDVKMGSTVYARSSVYGIARAEPSGGFQPRERRKTGTRIEIRGVSQKRVVDALTLEAQCAALHPGVAIRVQ